METQIKALNYLKGIYFLNKNKGKGKNKCEMLKSFKILNQTEINELIFIISIKYHTIN